MDEAATCRIYVIPKLTDAGWYNTPHDVLEQKTFTDGRIVAVGRKVKRRPEKRADYLLMYQPDFTIAVVEAKDEYKLPSHGLQQAKEYAEILGLKFAYATNGHGIVEFDYTTGQERVLNAFPTPDELWARLCKYEGITDPAIGQKLLTPSYVGDKTPRYYQQIAINRAVQAIVKGQRRVLITMATGTGKTFVAFQICWKLWNGRWNRKGTPWQPRILYLADRNILVDDPKDKMFVPFGDARHKIEHGQINKSRHMYFAIYQAIAERDNNPGLYKQYARDFFDLIIVDECHRGSANEKGSWREILTYFEPAYQIGMTATPKREDNIDTYSYFGDAVYTYSLRQGIEDGFLAPYHVHRIETDYDRQGWRPGPQDLDRYGRQIPEKRYTTKEFERAVALQMRTEAIARHLTEFLKRTDRFAKTIVFCVDQEHADAMRRTLNNLNTDLTQTYPNYVCRVTSDEQDIGRRHLSNFQELEFRPYDPVILTTSQLLTTGIDVPTCKNIVIVRVINSMTEFKQIIGRGTRVRDDYGKYYFNIIDYTGSATTLFADPAFDGEPVSAEKEAITKEGLVVEGSKEVTQYVSPDDVAFAKDEEGQGERKPGRHAESGIKRAREPRKYYFDGGRVEIVGDQVYELDADDNRLRMVKLTEYVADKVSRMYTNAAGLREAWTNVEQRTKIVEYLANRGIDFDELAYVLKRPDADAFDLLCYLAFSTPLRTRRERADRVLREQRDFFEQHSEQARKVLQELLEVYASYGAEQFVLKKVLKLDRFASYGNISEISRLFGGAGKLREAVERLQTLLYTDAA